MQHLNLPVSQGQEVAIGHRQVHPSEGQKAFRPGLGLHLRPAEELPVQVMHDHQRPGAAGPEIVAGDMIGVAVGADEKAQPPAFLVERAASPGAGPPGPAGRASRLVEQATR